MNIKFTGAYKSLTTFEWNEIPSLSIISGINGTGKSQLLELISNYYSYLSHSKDTSQKTDFYDLTIQNLEPVKNGLLYWQPTGQYINLEDNKFGYPDLEKITEFLIGYIHNNQNAIQKLYLEEDEYEAYRNGISRLRHALDSKKEKIIIEIETRSGKSRIDLSAEEISYYFPEEFLLEDFDLFNQDSLDLIFFFYIYKKIANEKYNLDLSLPIESPWDILNNVIKQIGLPYEITHPSDELIIPIFKNALNRVDSKRFNIQLINPNTKEDIGFNNLSSGERVLMSLALLLYYSQNRNSKKSLLLLDEPDAHLHPSLTKQFFEVIYSVMIKQYGCKILLTTHSPSTIALAPDNYDCKIFEMKKNPTAITEVIQRHDIISVLSDGLLIVTPKTHFTIVEGKNDKPFYETVYKILLSKNLIEKNPAIVFVPGKSVDSVIHFVKELREAGQNEIQGIIDKDLDNPETDGVRRLERYSIENYLLDPILFFVTMTTKPNELLKYDIYKGDEDKIKHLKNEDLQFIANIILSKIEEKLDNPDTEKVEIEYIDNKKITIPKWLINKRGKDLLPLFQTLGGGTGAINHNTLQTNLKRTNLITVDLNNLLQRTLKNI